MFTDVIILDQCRYFYDWLPTLDLLPNAILDSDHGLIYQMLMDGINRQVFFYDGDVFFGAALMGKYTRGFQAYELKARISID